MNIEILSFLSHIKNSYSGIQSIWLIGSRANEKANENSDWDFLAFADKKTLDLLEKAIELHKPNVDFLVVTDGENFQNAWGEKTKSGTLSLWKWRVLDDTRAEYSGVKWSEDVGCINLLCNALQVTPASKKHSSNLEIEKHYFDMFRQHFPLPNGRVIHQDKPDVIIIDENKKIGIEIARLFSLPGSDKSSEQVQKKMREDVLKRAKKLYETTNTKKIELSISFNSEHPILNPKNTATAVANLAKKIHAFSTGSIPRNLFKNIPEIKYVTLISDTNASANWQIHQGYTGRSLMLDRLVELIAEKEAKLPGYEQCGEYWLLVIVDWFDLGQDQEIEWQIENKPIESSFSKVIIFKTVFNQITDIPLQRKQ